MSVTGDSRALQGNIDGDTFYLSGFTGSRPYYVSGKIESTGGLTGRIGTDPDRASEFKGERAGKLELPDAYALTDAAGIQAMPEGSLPAWRLTPFCRFPN